MWTSDIANALFEAPPIVVMAVSAMVGFELGWIFNMILQDIIRIVRRKDDGQK